MLICKKGHGGFFFLICYVEYLFVCKNYSICTIYDLYSFYSI